MAMAEAADFRGLDRAENIPVDGVRPYYLEDLKRRVSVARVGNRLYAFDDLCTRDECPLSAGLLTGTTLMCPCDGSLFDITCGAVLRGPATRPLATYEVRKRDGEIRVRVK
jgi:nitrite reductase/ring-hydroxylating ferredoxin subunit